MIEVFKIIKQKYDSFAVPELLPSSDVNKTFLSWPRPRL